MTRPATVILLAALACRPEAARDRAPDSTIAAVAVLDTTATPAAESAVADPGPPLIVEPDTGPVPPPPATPFVDRGSCPFECCQLGNWTAYDSVAVFPEEQGRGRPSFFIVKNDTVHADSADFFTLELGVVLVRQTVRLADYLGGEIQDPPATRADSLALAALRRPIPPGDTIYITGHTPEIGIDVWYRGRSATISPFWDERASKPDQPGVQLRPIKHEWWVRITHHGRRGWIQAWGHGFAGFDACG